MRGGYGSLPGTESAPQKTSPSSGDESTVLLGRDENPYAEGVRAPIPWNFYLIYVGSTLYFMSYSLEGATGSLTLLYFNYKGWGSTHQDRLYVAAMCSQAAMPIYAAPILGYWATKKQIKPLLVYCQIASLLGCLLAAVANRPALILLALNMMAVSGYSTQPLRTSYIARSVNAKERTKWQSILAFTMLLGAAISPFITLACSQAPEPPPMTAQQQSEIAYWSVNRYTLVYLTGAALTAVVIVVTHLFFLEHPNDKSAGIGAPSAGELAMSLAEERWARMPEEDRACYRRVQTYFALLFCMDGISQGMMSVSIYPILGDVYDLSAQRMSLITMVLSFIALLPPAMAAVLSKWLADKEIMTLGLILKTVGVIVTLIPTPEYSNLGQWLFVIGYVFVVKASLFFLMSGTSNLTKQLGDQANPQNMSYNVASRNFGNFLGMLIAGPFILSWYHTWTWLVVAVPVAIAWVLLVTPYFWVRLDPLEPGTPKWVHVGAWARLRVDDDPTVLQTELRAMRSDGRTGGGAGLPPKGMGVLGPGGVGGGAGYVPIPGGPGGMGGGGAGGGAAGGAGWGGGAAGGGQQGGGGGTGYEAVGGPGVDLRERNSRGRGLSTHGS